MSRYIDTDALKRYIDDAEFCIKCQKKKLCCDIDCPFPNGLTKEWERAINEQPTVDAVPVVHAHWIIKPHGTYGQLRAFCSACGKHSGIGGIVSNQKKPYCPNCGAIMDGKEIVDG